MSTITSVFNSVSLERQPKLWLSTSDSEQKQRQRLKLVLSHEEFRFGEIIKKDKNLKNDKLAEAFWMKSKNLGDNSLNLLNRAYILAESETFIKEILRTRSELLTNLDLVKDALEDLKTIRVMEDEEEVDQIDELIRSCLKKIEINNNDDNNNNNNNNEDGKERMGFEDCVEVVSDPHYGRLVRAGRRILPGELLAQDNPEIRMLNAAQSRTHCWHCLNRVRVARVCPNCCSIVFCSTKCSKIATSYHKWECGYTSHLFEPELGAWCLAFRALTLYPDLALSALLTHSGSTHFSAPELMREAVVAVFMLRLLQQNGFNVQNELETSLCLLHWMRVSSFNCHQVLRKEQNDQNPYVIGMALNNNLALINHSCDPNQGRVWHWTQNNCFVRAFATRIIEKGDQIFDCYSQTFAIENKEERQLTHKRYNFQCFCRACTENWSVINEMSKKIRKKVNNLNDIHQVCRTIEQLDNSDCTSTTNNRVLRNAVENKLHHLLWNKYTNYS